MKINFNMSAIIANNALTNSDNGLAAALERLSSGFKINHSKDDPSGLAISKRMNAQIEGLGLASTNANSGISVIETAEGALTEIHAMLQRMNELAVQGSSGTCTTADRMSIQGEIDQLSREISRTATETEFNGLTLLDGTYDLKGYSNEIGINVDTYSDDTPTKEYGLRVNRKATFNPDGSVNIPANVTLDMSSTSPFAFPADARVEYNGNEVRVVGSNNFEIKFNIDELDPSQVPTPVDKSPKLNITGYGAMQIQIGANEGQQLDVRIPTVSLKTLNIEKLNVKTEQDARKSLTRIDSAIAYTSQVRSRLGAYQNRLDHSISSLDITNENMTAAYARIMDVNMATEMTEYTKFQILTQAGTSMLAQANERPQKLLQLLE